MKAIQGPRALLLSAPFTDELYSITVSSDFNPIYVNLYFFNYTSSGEAPVPTVVDNKDDEDDGVLPAPSPFAPSPVPAPSSGSPLHHFL